jgi:hypothetical protein
MRHDKNNLDRFEMNLFNMMQSIRFVDNGGGAGQQSLFIELPKLALCILCNNNIGVDLLFSE